jgi:hypothetical protein
MLTACSSVYSVMLAVALGSWLAAGSAEICAADKLLPAVSESGDMPMSQLGGEYLVERQA